MPILHSDYEAPKLFHNGHIQTLYPYFFRKPEELRSIRMRVTTPDNDFLDYDFINMKSKKLIILTHGLEGSSNSPYIKGMQRNFTSIGFDVIAWNMRGCSGEMNKLERFYHGGDTDDLGLIIEEALKIKNYKEVYLIGFSLGGNITLKYIGERKDELNSKIKKACAFSTPTCLKAGSIQLQKSGQKIYEADFLRTMKKKILTKNEIIPITSANLDNLKKVKNLLDFDNYFTAPIHGFKDAEDYYSKCSAKPFLSSIKIPTLIVNAKNDPFLGKENFPVREAYRSNNLFLEMPRSGGHVGFINFNDKNRYWSERKAEEFFLKTL